MYKSQFLSMLAFDNNISRPLDQVEPRGPKRPRNTERTGSAQRHSTGNAILTDAVPIKQENQGTEKASPWVAANKASKGAEWWRKP
jgi:hypothetical protein